MKFYDKKRELHNTRREAVIEDTKILVSGITERFRGLRRGHHETMDTTKLANSLFTKDTSSETLSLQGILDSIDLGELADMTLVSCNGTQDNPQYDISCSLNCLAICIARTIWAASMCVEGIGESEIYHLIITMAEAAYRRAH